MWGAELVLEWVSELVLESVPRPAPEVGRRVCPEVGSQTWSLGGSQRPGRGVGARDEEIPRRSPLKRIAEVVLERESTDLVLE